MRRLSIGVAVVVAVGAGNVAFAQSKCDSTITKAAGKKAACKAGVISKAQKSGGAADATRLAKCEAKFAKTCGNGQADGDCVVQSGSCAGIEATVDACVTTLTGNAAPTTTTTTLLPTTTSLGPTTTTTVPAVCGNSTVDAGEVCDRGFYSGSCNNENGCSAACFTPGCPVGYVCPDCTECVPVPRCYNCVFMTGDTCNATTGVNSDQCAVDSRCVPSGDGTCQCTCGLSRCGFATKCCDPAATCIDGLCVVQ